MAKKSNKMDGSLTGAKGLGFPSGNDLSKEVKIGIADGNVHATGKDPLKGSSFSAIADPTTKQGLFKDTFVNKPSNEKNSSPSEVSFGKGPAWSYSGTMQDQRAKEIKG